MKTYENKPESLYVVIIQYPSLGIHESMAAIYGSAQAALSIIAGRGQDRIMVYRAKHPSYHASGNIYSSTGGLDYITIEKLQELAVIEKDPAAHIKDSENVFKQSHEQN
jgi:hypothetical protein